MTWVDDVLSGKFDDDNGGRQPVNRRGYRQDIRAMRRLADGTDMSQGVLTREDLQVVLELGTKLVWLATTGIRIRLQQSNSWEKEGRIE